jgi:TolA-binding protein
MMRPHKTFVALASLIASTAYGKPKHASEPQGRPRPEASAYLEELERRGLVDKGLGTPERLASEVRAADADLVAGNPAAAAARLYAIVEAPRWQDLSDTEDFQDAEYRLGIALHSGGGVESARRYFVRALQRGAQAPFFEASLRGYVDVCLDERVLEACAAELDRVGVESALSAAPKGDAQAASQGELAYLRGRAAFEAGRADEAEDQLKRVTPKSRFYSSALYLRGVLRVNRRDYKGAQDAFCTIADVKEGDTLRFFIDGRYYALRDLARLALARISHELGRYDDAFYHYFLVPQDSNRLGEALFEAAWSSLERRDYHLGARLVEEFLKAFPGSPRAAEARLLFATLQVKTCRFAQAEKGFAEFVAQHEPLLAAIDRALADPSVRGGLAERVLNREAGRESGEDRLLSLLQLDGRFFRIEALARGLRAEALDAGHVAESWRQLQSRVAGQRSTLVAPVLGTPLDPPHLRARVEELGAEVARTRAALRGKSGADAEALKQSLDALAARRTELAATLDRTLDVSGLEETPAAAGVAGLSPMVAADLSHAAELGTKVARLDQKLKRASGELMIKALVDLRAHLEDLLRRARLGKIDAVVGQKRKLEKQIEDLAAGRFPPEMFGKLHIEGLIKDDEEYWPPEPEIWLDEYENYK